MRCIRSLLLATALAATPPGVLAGEALFASRIYRPDPMPALPVEWAGNAPQEITVETSDGLALRGFYWAPAKPGADVLVFFHGNGGNRVTAAQMAAPLVLDGRGVLVASYRGYGDNPGEPTEAGLFRDGRAFLARARALAPGAPILLFGYSMGGAVALKLASEEEVRGVVTLGAFSSLAAVAPRLVSGLLAGTYDNRATIRGVDEPVLILHGDADEVVPFEQARVLQAAAPRARLLTLQGAPHRIPLDALAATIWANVAQMPE